LRNIERLRKDLLEEAEGWEHLNGWGIRRFEIGKGYQDRAGGATWVWTGDEKMIEKGSGGCKTQVHSLQFFEL
jgi:hypothetical protein